MDGAQHLPEGRGQEAGQGDPPPPGRGPPRKQLLAATRFGDGQRTGSVVQQGGDSGVAPWPGHAGVLRRVPVHTYIPGSTDQETKQAWDHAAKMKIDFFDIDAVSMATFFSYLREFGDFCDGALVSADGDKFDIHRCYVIMKSSVMARVFAYNSSPNHFVKLRTISTPLLQTLVDQIYMRDNVEDHINAENVIELFKVATEFRLPALLEASTTFLKHSLSTENCVGIWKFAENFFAFDLQEEAFAYLMKNFPAVHRDSEEFLEVESRDISLMLGDDKVVAASEQDLLDALGKWVLHRPYVRSIDGVTLLQKIRFGTMRNYNGDFPTVAQIKTKYPSLRLWPRWEKKYHSFLRAHGQTEGGEVDVDYHLDCQQVRPRVPNHVIMTIGGWSGSNPTTTVEIYDFRADRWFRSPALNPSFRRAYHGTVVIGMKIYVFGGYDGRYFFNTMNVLDTTDVGKAWQPLSCMNHARCYVTYCVYKGDIWAIGGLDGTSRMRTVEKYTVATNQWDLLPNMNVPRSDGCAVVHKGRVFICGGFDGHAVLSTVEYFNVCLNRWVFAPRMEIRRSGLSAVSYQGSLTVLGGFNGETRTSHVERFDEASRSWIPLPDMNMAKSNFTTVVIENKLFAFGGYDGNSTIGVVECYDPARDHGPEWTFVCSMSLPKSALGVAVLPMFIKPFSYLNHMEHMVENPEEDNVDMEQAPIEEINEVDHFQAQGLQGGEVFEPEE